jgi:acyl-CoA hydrolase
VHLGNLITLKSSVNRAFTTSMEVGVKVWAEDTQTGKVLHVASAFLVFVAIDKQGRRVRVPEVIPETAEEQRHYADALLRREHRIAEATRRKQEKHAHATLENADAAEPQAQ